MLRLLPVLFCMLLFAGCGNGHHHRAMLLSADSIVDTDADSALALLRAIDTCALRNPADRALYALLTARALDKTGVELASDSVVAPAVAYYTASSDPLRYAMSQYYLGRARYNADRYASSLAAMFAAHDAAKSTGNHFWIAMTARGIAANYNMTRNAAEEYKYHKIAYAYFHKIGKEPHAIYALLDIGIGLHNIHRYDVAIKTMSQVLDSAIAMNDSQLELEARKNLARSFYGQKNYTRSIMEFHALRERFDLSPSDSAFLGLSYSSAGKLDEAENILADLSLESEDIADIVKYRVYLHHGDFRNALKTLENVDRRTNEIFATITSSDVTSTVLDYYNDVKQLKESEAEAASQRLKLMCLVVSLFVLLCAACVIYYVRSRQYKIDKYLRLAQEFHDTLEIKKEECTAYQAAIKKLVATRFDLFDKFCSLYYGNVGNKMSAQQISAVVVEILHGLRPGTGEYAQLEQYADENYNNIMSDLRELLPNLKTKDYALFLYSILGFSITSIAALLDENKVASVYERKRRLKLKIMSTDGNPYSRFLVLL